MKTKAQSTIEYAVLITILAIAVVSMDLYVKRAVQANLKGTEEQINALTEDGVWKFEVTSPPGPGPRPRPRPGPRPRRR
jgi:Flp pilus assembly pilin Flp